MTVPVQTCPHCEQDIPVVLYDAHVAACDDNTETAADGQLLIREPEDTSPSLPDAGDPSGDEPLFEGMSFPTANDEDEEEGVTDEDPLEDEFDRLVGQLEIDPSIVEVNVATLDDLELNSRFNQVKQELLERKEMIEAKTQTGRDLHSQRAAYLIELRRRGLSD